MNGIEGEEAGSFLFDVKFEFEIKKDKVCSGQIRFLKATRLPNNSKTKKN